MWTDTVRSQASCRPKANSADRERSGSSQTSIVEKSDRHASLSLLVSGSAPGLLIIGQVALRVKWASFLGESLDES